MYRAVLFDVGGPIDTEILHEQRVDEYLLLALRGAGMEVSAADLDAANAWAVQSYAPHAYHAIIWRLCGSDPALAALVQRAFDASTPERQARRGGLELRPGIDAVIRGLHDRGLLLGLAANQPAGVIAELDRFGLGQCFSHREVTGHHGYAKPDTRLFLRACEDLDVRPDETIMVGDRIDNDISPAKVLGMGTVLFRTGRHIEQQPRSLHEVPDAEVRTVDELQTALANLLERS